MRIKLSHVLVVGAIYLLFFRKSRSNFIAGGDDDSYLSVVSGNDMAHANNSYGV